MLHDSYSQAAEGMRTYANDVEEIQYRAGVVNQELSSAEHAHSSAASAQAGWRPPPPADPAVVLLTAPDPAASKNPHDEQVAAAQARVQAALEQRRALADDRRSADSKVKGTLHNAQDMGMHNRSGWSHFWEGVSDTLGKLTIVLIVVAVVAVVLMPALAPLAFGALMAASAAKLGVDSGRKIAGEDVSWGEIAMDALGVIPGGVYARAGGLAAKGAAQGVRAAEKLAPTAVAAARTSLAAASAGVKGSAAAARAAKALAAARRPLAKANQRVDDFAVNRAVGRGLSRYAGSAAKGESKAAAGGGQQFGTETTHDLTNQVNRLNGSTTQTVEKEVSKQVATRASGPVSYKRPTSFRKDVRSTVWENARDVNGVVYDRTGVVIHPGDPWQMGHEYGFEFRKHRASSEVRGIPRTQFLDEHNNPTHYRPELPASNANHEGEAPDDVYFGP
ncbi:hypothetical protein EH165_03870 [Nakamurella antarctica]|uniref:Toxin YqcG C-terminal domain-containing protein n=2 Tax=Nakamurella antarctica TaxID=1902245 RepID=A0A3G8ZSC8_9ACTN|nr:HNH/ENDO VII family nuclease [Nakamurella antarctica]AZI57424.1 hypothetical protein EH165_03870 [Nakamurella antarctica]